MGSRFTADRAVRPDVYAAFVLTLRDLNRTLLLRQHLLERTKMPALQMVEHLIGLQAQENLPPYLSLAARIEGFDPLELSDALERKAAVRFLTMRGHHPCAGARRRAVAAAVGAGRARPAERIEPDQQAGEGASLPTSWWRRRGGSSRRVRFRSKQLGERLAEAFPDVPAGALVHTARERVPMLQVPPRGLWKQSGGVVYQTVENYLGRPTTELDVRELVRRYLRAFGPGTAADMTTWSRVTRLGPVFQEMADELVVVECEDGKKRYDVPGAPYAEGDVPAPVRLLGTYDNVWLSHANRDHIVPIEMRSRWAGTNGGVGNTIFIDGFMAGLWWVRDGRAVTEVFRKLSKREQAELDEEVAAVDALLAR